MNEKGINRVSIMKQQVLIETDRLIIRPYKIRDFKNWYEYRNDELTMKYQGGIEKSIIQVLRTFILCLRNKKSYWAVELKDNSKMIGNIFVKKENDKQIVLGYIFNRKYWGKGYATESINTVIKDFFQKGGIRVYAEIDNTNTSSIKLITRLGFTLRAKLDNWILFSTSTIQDNWHDKYIYSLENTVPIGKNNGK